MIRQISRKVGGLRNLVFIGIFFVLVLVLLLDIYVVDKILEPIEYFYLFFAKFSGFF